MNIYQPVISGSLTVTGSTTFFGNITINSGSLTMTSGSLTGTASFSTSASYAYTASSATSASYSYTASSAVSSSYALTSSFSNNFNVAGNLTASNAVFSGTLTAQTLVVQTITSSIDYVTGSTRFGSLMSNTHTFTGSLNITGSQTITGNINIASATGFPTVGFLNRASDSTLYTVAASSGFTVTDSSLNTMYNATPTSHTWNISNSPKLTISSSGNIGIFGQTPRTPSAVKTLESTNWVLEDNGSYGIKNNAYYNGTNNIYINASSTTAERIYISNGYHYYDAPAGTAGGTANFTERFTITNGGNVGIGITNPFSQLSLPSGTGWNGGLAWNYTTNNSSSKKWWINTDQIVYGDFRICTEITQGGGSINSAGTLYERLYIGPSGSVVLGLTSDFIGERLRIGGSTSTNRPAMAITSANPNVSCPSGVATTVYTFPSYPRVMFYMVFVRLDTGADANGYAAYAVVAASSVGSKLMTVVNGTYVTLTLSGLNVQINQTSGATQNAVVSVIQIFANGGSD